MFAEFRPLERVLARGALRQLILALCVFAPWTAALADTNSPAVLKGGGKLIIASNRAVADPAKFSSTAGFSKTDRSETVNYALLDPGQGETDDNDPLAAHLVRAQDLASLLSRDSGATRTAPHEALIYVHGFDNTTESAVHLAVHVANEMNFTGDVIVFAWPSRGAMTPPAYIADADTADRSKGALLKMLKQLADIGSIGSIEIIAHSLGNRIVVRSLASGQAPTKMGQVILCSPDVEKTEFVQSVPKIIALLQGATLWVSNNDRALLVAPTFGGGEVRAGLIDGTGDPIVLTGLATIDVSHETSLFDFNHNAYMQVRELFSDLSAVFDPSALQPWLNPAKKRHYLVKTTHASKTYWEYRK